jgi:flavin-dependent dehydrogenase
LTQRCPASTHRVVILGGGVAGCATALALCHHGIDDVLIAEAGAYDGFRIGESIPPETRLVMERLRIWDGFQSEGHEPCLGSRSVWGADIVGYNDYLLNPHGTGWHLDRRQFDAFMAWNAKQSGAELRSGARFVSAQRLTGEGFALQLRTAEGPQSVHAQFVVDATGRRSRWAKAMGARPLWHDRLVCITTVLGRSTASEFSQLTMLEAVETGWWYAASLPGARVLVTAVTDAETNRQVLLHQPEGWFFSLNKTRHMAGWLDDCSRRDGCRMVIAEAPSFVLDKICGSGWMAVGDAASAYDPISSAGIYKALSDGLQSAAAITNHLNGASDAFAAYKASVVEAFTEYLQNRNYFYNLEKRWPSSPFWQNRWQNSAIETVTL